MTEDDLRGVTQPKHKNILQQNKLQAAVALHKKGKLSEAANIYNEILRVDKNNFDALHFLGVIYNQIGRNKNSVDFISRAIKINPTVEAAYSNLGLALKDMKRLDEALASYDKAIELKPDYAEAYYNRGIALKELKRLDEALASYNKAIELKPDYAEACLNKSLAELLVADFVSGWKNYESRKKTKVHSWNRSCSQPLLTSLNEAIGKTVLVYWEQGLGDTMQFCRYVNVLLDSGVEVLFAPQPRLKNLSQALSKKVKIVDADDVPFPFDYHISLLSLPLLFETTLETIPALNPYLFANPALIDKWQGRIRENGFRIGICWMGNSTYKDDASRSFDVNLFEPLAKIPSVRLISLQKSDCEDQLKSLPDGMVIETLGHDFDSGSDAFIDTAAVMVNLDLVITSDTSIAHLAGALGVPIWVALKYVPDWRWMLDRLDSPWYPTMRLFRQKRDGDWKSVMEDIGAELSRLSVIKKR